MSLADSVINQFLKTHFSELMGLFSNIIQGDFENFLEDITLAYENFEEEIKNKKENKSEETIQTFIKTFKDT